MINYRSLSDLSQDILEGIHKIPYDIDLVVGIPRSGMLAATQIALLRNLKVCSLQEYLLDLAPEHGETRTAAGHKGSPSTANRVLIVDDSIASGRSLANVRQRINESKFRAQHIYLAVYTTLDSAHLVDITLKTLSMPRTFQWNLMHRQDLGTVYFDMDGILCIDPTQEENDDGKNYLRFIESAKPLVLPSMKIGGIITSRLEKYRPQTEAWLAKHGVRYGKLFMLDLPDARTRQRLMAHGSFKASVYSSIPDATLFVESETNQAREIHSLTNKPVVDFHGTRGFGVNLGISRSDILKSRFPTWLRKMPSFYSIIYDSIKAITPLKIWKILSDARHKTASNVTKTKVE